MILHKPFLHFRDLSRTSVVQDLLDFRMELIDGYHISEGVLPLTDSFSGDTELIGYQADRLPLG